MICKSSYNAENIATSYDGSSGYFISTVNQKRLQPSYPFKYCTIIKHTGISTSPTQVLATDSAKEALLNHLGAIRMINGSDKELWTEELVRLHATTMTINALANSPLDEGENNFDSPCCQNLLRIYGSNFIDRRKGLNFKKLIIGLIIFGILIWIFKH